MDCPFRPHPHWIRGSLIGAGSFGRVNLAINAANGNIFAVKSIDCVDTKKEELSAIDKELQILQSLDSSHIVRCFGSDYTVENGVLMRNLFMEYMAGGSLADIITKFGGQLEESLVRVYTRGILEGLHYLHGRGIVHCDIKAKNILIGSTEVKIADFGAAKKIGIDTPTGKCTDAAQSVKGTLLWMAPEVVQQVEQGPPSDIWSLGCTMLEMVTGLHPWSNSPNVFAALYRIGCTDEIPTLPCSISSLARDFLHKCFQRDPTARWTSAELLKHPFLSEDWKNDCSSVRYIRPPSPNSVLPNRRDWGNSQTASFDYMPLLSVGAKLVPHLNRSLGPNLNEESTSMVLQMEDDGKEERLIARGLKETMLAGPGSTKFSHVETGSTGSPLVGQWLTVFSRNSWSESRQKPLSEFMLQPFSRIVAEASRKTATGGAAASPSCEVCLECPPLLENTRQKCGRDRQSGFKINVSRDEGSKPAESFSSIVERSDKPAGMGGNMCATGDKAAWSSTSNAKGCVWRCWWCPRQEEGCAVGSLAWIEHFCVQLICCFSHKCNKTVVLLPVTTFVYRLYFFEQQQSQKQS